MDEKVNTTNVILLPNDNIDIKGMIYVVRGQQVMMDSDLAMLYQVTMKTQENEELVTSAETCDWILEEEDGLLRRIGFQNDPTGMNWVKENEAWGKNSSPEGITCRISRKMTDKGWLEETYHFTNSTAWDIYCPEGSVSIEVPLHDNYLEADVCLPLRCHAHVWCGGNVSWIMALRMGGAPPHLGLILREGSLCSYSIRRSLKESHCVSNTRGVFLLHPESFHLAPGQTYTIRWQIFGHQGKQDFIHILKSVPGVRMLESEQWIAFQGEKVCWTNGEVETSRLGEIQKSIQTEKGSTFARWLVIPDAEELLRRRAEFIVEKQQCLNQASRLYGAYLIYDNETKEQYYSHTVHDHNSARERLGMGALVALELQRERNRKAEESLYLYADFILREIYDKLRGVVCNDAGYSLDWHRLYNYPWVCIFMMELYRLDGDKSWLIRAVDVMKGYYNHGGLQFYAIGIPMTELVALLESAGLGEIAQEMRMLFVQHAQQIASVGIHYPPSEVDYEQSIVAPAVDYLLMGYELCGDECLLTAAREQLVLLDLFHGIQPDYHLNEVAIRHWDGKWFGKRELLGDTFPHYWSSLSGIAYERYGMISGEHLWLEKAERNLRGSLPLFFVDGSASCAMVYPRSINGMPGNYFDPWANDQDWGLYYYFRRPASLKKKD